ncbi:MAG: response regulator transcription factor [Anaerolineae bacterium]|nr:response regulator transcription factor [Anaerolineae bacterium]
MTPYIQAALQAGANGYVLKSSDADEITNAVRAVYEGKQVLDSRMLQYIDESSVGDTSTTKLTDREIDVRRLAAHGMTNKAIDFQLAISDHTVQGHLANLYEKLGVSSRTEAVTRAVAHGLIDVPR